MAEQAGPVVERGRRGAVTVSTSGRLVTETFEEYGGRNVTVFVPSDQAKAVVFAGDGQRLALWGADLESFDLPSTMIVGLHNADDETERIREYVLGVSTSEFQFDAARFEAHERFLLDAVRPWALAHFGASSAVASTAVWGVSAGAEFALAMGLRHPHVFGAVLAASPGAGFRPSHEMARFLPRTYLLAGDQEPFFLENALRWSNALTRAEADVVVRQRTGSHGGQFWRTELPQMIAWAFTRHTSRGQSKAVSSWPGDPSTLC